MKPLDDREADQLRDAGLWPRSRPGPLYKGECHRCGKVLYTRTATRKWCSDRCSNGAQIERRRERNAMRRRKICQQCGEPFQASRKDGVFCSSACRQKAYRARCAVTDTGRYPGGTA